MTTLTLSIPSGPPRHQYEHAVQSALRANLKGQGPQPIRVAVFAADGTLSHRTWEAVADYMIGVCDVLGVVAYSPTRIDFAIDAARPRVEIVVGHE